MKPNQRDAIKLLEAALLRCKRAGLALVGVDDNLLVTVADASLADEIADSSACGAIVARCSNGHPDTTIVKS